MAKQFTADLSRFFTLVVVGVSMLLGACTFRTPADEGPKIQSQQEVRPKSFFFRNQVFEGGSRVCSDQVFLAAWAPVDERGILGEAYTLRGVPRRAHLNLRFCVTEKSVIGYEVNPSYPDQKDHWISRIEIPIVRHYHLERQKDGYQRDTNKVIKNEARDGWQFQPYMDLDFQKIVVNDWAYSSVPTWIQAITGTPASAPSGIAVSDIEWDEQRQFLGFTVETKDSNYAPLAQVRYRFNFLAFDSKRDFNKTPYDETLSKHINVLHLVGGLVDGTTNRTYAGHWDVRKPVTFYTYGVPEKYMDIVQDSIKEWNEAFVRAGVVPEGQDALLLDTRPIKYPFDLRYPVIHWVSEKRESLNSPLGIGIASADVTNGEFLHGSVTVWTGILEEYMNRFSVGEADAMATAAVISDFHVNRSQMFDEDLLQRSLSANLPAAGGLGIAQYLRSHDAYDRLQKSLEVLENSEQWMAQQAIEHDPELREKARQGVVVARQSVLTPEAYAGFLEADLHPDLRNPIYFEPLSVFRQHFSDSIFEGPAIREVNQSEMLPFQAQRLERDMRMAELQRMVLSTVRDADRVVADVLPGMIAAMSESGRSEREILRSTFKFLLLHEIGHVLGLGHNFKGNMLPHKHEVAEVHYNQLKEQLESKGYVATTVMDYYNPRTEAIMNYEDIKIGPYDEQMLRYLYKGEYPVMSPDRKRVSYRKIDADGVAPEVVRVPGRRGKGGGEARIAFLPACNDIDASTNVNPYCMRHDRGHNATTSMVSRFRDFNATLQSMLNAYSRAKNSDPYARTSYLWYKSLHEFSQIRSFYDYMRLQLDEREEYRDAFRKISRDQEALLSFSDACRDPNLALSTDMQKEFAKLALRDPSKLGTSVDLLSEEDFTDVRDLCVANKYALDQFAEIMKRKGSDYTTYDRMHRYVVGGLRGGDVRFGWSNIWGSFREIGSFPIRLSTLYMVTSPYPYFLGWGMYPVGLYDTPQGLYSYAPLFPREYSSIIDTTVRESLNLGGGELEEKTEMGKSLMYVNYLMNMNRFLSKDNDNRFPPVYLDNLTRLTEFQIQVSPVILTNVTKEGKRDTLVFNYAASYVDLAQRDAMAIPYAYLLPDRRVVAQGNDKQVFLPITRFRYLSDRWGYAWALDLKYHIKDDDPLKGFSVKYGLDRMAQQQLERCAQSSTGLSSFFNTTHEAFEGFEVGTGIATKPDLQQRFDESVKRAFATYHATPFGDQRPDPNACEDTLRSMDLIVGGAAMINGYWLPQAIKYLNF